MADSNIQTLDTVKPITLDEYQERTAHLQENTTSLLSTIADNQVQAASLATQAASLASEVNAVAEQASLSFTKKTWTDNATSGTPITAAELNRLENAISSLTTAVNNLQDSVSHASGKAGSVSYFKTAGIVIVSCLFVRVTIGSSWGSATIGRLPEGFRPASRVIAPIASDWASGNMSIDANGTVAINANNDTISTASSISSIAVFPAA